MRLGGKHSKKLINYPYENFFTINQKNKKSRKNASRMMHFCGFQPFLMRICNQRQQEKFPILCTRSFFHEKGGHEFYDFIGRWVFLKDRLPKTLQKKIFAVFSENTALLAARMGKKKAFLSFWPAICIEKDTQPCRACVRGKAADFLRGGFHKQQAGSWKRYESF